METNGVWGLLESSLGAGEAPRMATKASRRRPLQAWAEPHNGTEDLTSPRGAK